MRVLLLTLSILGFAGCSSLLYYPTRIVYVDPATIEVTPEDCAIDADGIKIKAWYFHPQANPPAVIVLFHGNAENRSSHFTGLYWLVKEGYDLFVFDYPGYADSTGRPSPASTLAAGKAALRYVHSRWPRTPLIVYGQSLGGAVALRSVLELKGEIAPALVVADSTFLSYKSAARSVASHMWLTWPLQPLTYLLFSDKYAPGDLVKGMSPTPLLVIHSRQDEVIPFQLGEEVYEKAAEPKEFWPMETGPHISTFRLPQGEEFRHRFLGKLNEILTENRKKNL